MLRATGFTGVDFEIGDCEDPHFQTQSTIMSTAEQQTSYPSSISIVYAQDFPPPSWLDQLTKVVQSRIGTVPVVESFDMVQVTDDTVYIFVAEMIKAFLNGIDDATFRRLRDLLVKSQGILWLSCSDTINAKEPIYAQVQGLLRCLKQEDINKRCILLDFDSDTSPWTTESISHIVQVLQQSFNYNDDALEIDREYAVKDLMIHVPRFYPDMVRERALIDSKADLAPSMEPFWKSNRSLVWETGQSGLLNNLYFTETFRDNGDLLNSMIEIEAKAFGLNFRDVMVALNQLDESLIGHDCSGIVKRLGPGTEQSKFKIGDRVCCIAKGRFASVGRAFWTSVAKIPDNMSWEAGASLPIT